MIEARKGEMLAAFRHHWALQQIVNFLESSMGFAYRQNPHDNFDVPPSRSEKFWLAAILIGAFTLRSVLSIVLPSVYHPDEVFQYLEQGHRLAFGYGVIPWEFREGVRSWLVPGFLGGLMWATVALGGGVAAYLAVIGCVLSAISSTVVLVAWLWARRIAGPMAAVTAGIVAATWVEFVYAGSKPLTEILAGSALFAGAYVLCSRSPVSQRALVFGGLLLGLAFVLRLQLAPAILVIVLFACATAPFRVWLIVGICGAAVVLLSGILDWITWGQPFQSMWKNFHINIITGRADRYGVSPWYYYVSLYVWSWSGAIVPMAALMLFGAWRLPIALAVPLVIVLSHTAIGHKEMRFLYPALPFLLLAAAIGLVGFAEGMSRAWKRFGERAMLAAVVAAWVATSLVLAVGERFRPAWTRQADRLEAVADIRDRDVLCGVGIVSLHWFSTGGYVNLHRDLPIYPVDGSDTLMAIWDSFDVALAHRDVPLPEYGFRRGRCYSKDLCLYERTGQCVPRPDRAINNYLRKSDQ